ncbi:MAG: hypothetical protein P8126_01330 [Gammaproteobacteria bacterium]
MYSWVLANERPPRSLGFGLELTVDLGAEGGDLVAVGQELRGGRLLGFLFDLRLLLGGCLWLFFYVPLFAQPGLGLLLFYRQGLPGVRGGMLGRGLLLVNSLGLRRVLRWTRRCGGGDVGLVVRKRRRQRCRRCDILGGLAAALEIGLGQQLGVFGFLALLLDKNDLHGVVAGCGFAFTREGDAEDDDGMGNDGKAQGQSQPVQRRDLRAGCYFIQWNSRCRCTADIIPAAGRVL